MLRFNNRIFPVRMIVFLILIFTAGCLTIKTIPTNNISKLQPSRRNLRIHSEDSLWIINQYQVNGKFISGKLKRSSEGVIINNTADIYVAPINAIEIKGDTLTVSTDNIGKIDYQITDGRMIVPSVGIIFAVLFIILLMGS